MPAASPIKPKPPTPAPFPNAKALDAVSPPGAAEFVHDVDSDVCDESALPQSARTRHDRFVTHSPPSDRRAAMCPLRPAEASTVRTHQSRLIE
jgi:hypothetical protein